MEVFSVVGYMIVTWLLVVAIHYIAEEFPWVIAPFVLVGGGGTALLFAVIFGPLFLFFQLLKLIGVKQPDDSFDDFLDATGGYPWVISFVVGVSTAQAVTNWLCDWWQLIS